MGLGVVASSASYVGSTILSNSMLTTAKVFGENCPTDFFSGPYSNDACATLGNQILVKAVAGRVTYGLAVMGAAFISSAFWETRTVRPLDSGEEVELIEKPGQPKTSKLPECAIFSTWIVIGSGALGFAVDLFLTLKGRDISVDWGNCIAKNVTNVACEALGNTTSALSTADIVINSIVGAHLLGTLVWAGVRSRSIKQA